MIRETYNLTYSKLEMIVVLRITITAWGAEGLERFKKIAWGATRNMIIVPRPVLLLLLLVTCTFFPLLPSIRSSLPSRSKLPLNALPSLVTVFSRLCHWLREKFRLISTNDTNQTCCFYCCCYWPSPSSSLAYSYYLFLSLLLIFKYNTLLISIS